MPGFLQLVLLCGMFQVHADHATQLLTISFSENVDNEQMKRGLGQTTSALTSMKPGFRVLTDLSHLECMNPSCALLVGEIMTLCDQRGIDTVALVLPEERKDIGFILMTRFHYSSRVRICTFTHLPEAIRSLSSNAPAESS